MTAIANLCQLVLEVSNALFTFALLSPAGGFLWSLWFIHTSEDAWSAATSSSPPRSWSSLPSLPSLVSPKTSAPSACPSVRAAREGVAPTTDTPASAPVEPDTVPDPHDEEMRALRQALQATTVELAALRVQKHHEQLRRDNGNTLKTTLTGRNLKSHSARVVQSLLATITVEVTDNQAASLLHHTDELDQRCVEADNRDTADLKADIIADNKFKALKDRLTSLGNSLEWAQTKTNRLETQLKAAKKELSDQTAKSAEAAKRQSAAHKAEMDKAMHDAAVRNSRMGQQLKRSRQQVELLKADKQSEVANLNDKLSAATTKMEKLIAEKSALVAERDATKSHNTKLADDLEALRVRYDTDLAAKEKADGKDRKAEEAEKARRIEAERESFLTIRKRDQELAKVKGHLQTMKTRCKCPIGDRLET